MLLLLVNRALFWLNFNGFGGWIGSQRQQLHQVGYGEAPLLLLIIVYYSEHLFAVLLISASSQSEFPHLNGSYLRCVCESTPVTSLP